MKHFRNNADLLYEIKHSTPKRGNKREREREENERRRVVWRQVNEPSFRGKQICLPLPPKIDSFSSFHSQKSFTRGSFLSQKHYQKSNIHSSTLRADIKLIAREKRKELLKKRFDGESERLDFGTSIFKCIYFFHSETGLNQTLETFEVVSIDRYVGKVSADRARVGRWRDVSLVTSIPK